MKGGEGSGGHGGGDTRIGGEKMRCARSAPPKIFKNMEHTVHLKSTTQAHPAAGIQNTEYVQIRNTEYDPQHSSEYEIRCPAQTRNTEYESLSRANISSQDHCISSLLVVVASHLFS